MELQLSEQLASLPRMDYRKMTPLQGNLKDLTERNYEKLKNSIQKKGFRVPVFLWHTTNNDGEDEYFILDGHQRQRILTAEDATPYEIPYVEIQAETVTDAKEMLLAIASQYGTVTQEGFDEFSFDLDEELLKDMVNFDKLFDFASINLEQDLLPEDDSDEQEDVADTPTKTTSPNAQDDEYSRFELIMLHENKTRLNTLLDTIKKEEKLDTIEQAVVHLMNAYQQENQEADA